MIDDNKLMSDAELDRILNLASKPELPVGATRRLMEAAEAQSNVVAFATRTSPTRAHWLAGLPLAASLLFGLYLGASPDAVDLLPSFAQDLILGSEEEALSGVEDVEAVSEEDLS